MTCELCESDGGKPVWRDARCRVVEVAEPGYPGYCRVIWNAHIAEMTDLCAEDREHCIRIVLAVETALRDALHPDKINLASLGNFTPHLHWHVIPRYRDDEHFPNSIWGTPMRKAPATSRATADLAARIAAHLSALYRNK